MEILWKIRIGVFAVVALLQVAQSAPLNSNEWAGAQWIELDGDSRPESSLLRRSCKVLQDPVVQLKTFPSPLMRHEFLVSKKVKQATAYVCGLGYFELYMNGKKVGDHVLDPVQTTYDKRACYVTFDVTPQLQSGPNAVGLMLGNGFFGQNFAFVRGLKWGKPTAIALVMIEYTDGSRQAITTGPQWKATTGPIVFDNVYVGETYDARLEIPGWSGVGFDSSEWAPVSVREAPTKKLIEQLQPPIKKIQQIQPVNLMLSEDGGWILDMGKNFTGWLQIRVKEKRGSEIRMRFAEHLMPDGQSIDTKSTGVHVTGHDQTEIYVCKGDGQEEWEPRFTYHGFRYVQIDGLSKKPNLDDFTGWMIRTDVDRIGTFECSDPLFNKFYDISMWTIECNLQGVLSDCPHREKCAWMGDMHAVGEVASMNFNLMEFWRKASEDMKTVTGAQPVKSGSVFPYDIRVPSNVSVGKRLCQQARPDWGVATVLVPWFSYLCYGDDKIVETAWPLMKGWVDFIEEFGLKTGVIEEGYGDWCPPGGNKYIDTPVGLSSTALFYQALQAMEKMAITLDKTEASEHYRKLAIRIRENFNARFYNEETGDYGSQTGTTMALHLNLVEEECRDAVYAALVQRIKTVDHGHYTSGIHGHRSIYTVLNDAGFGSVTSHMLHQADWPSLAYMTEAKGLTTWPEHNKKWANGERAPKGSYSHPMQGGFSICFQESICGIRPDPQYPGFKRIILKPCFLDGMEWAKATHKSVYGLISSHWKREHGKVIWDVTIPDGATAKLYLVSSLEKNESIKALPREGMWNVFVIGAGTHRFSISE